MKKTLIFLSVVIFLLLVLPPGPQDVRAAAPQAQATSRIARANRRGILMVSPLTAWYPGEPALSGEPPGAGPGPGGCGSSPVIAGA